MTPHGRHPLVIVAAVARNGVIGVDGGLPWRLPGDLAHFRALTMGHPLIMGRVTYESIGGPLPGRATTVMSHRLGFSPSGVAVAHDLAAALASADAQADRLGASAIMVVGGAAIYARTIELAQSLVITEVAAEPEGDAVFPTINPQRWRRTAVDQPPDRPDDECSYRFVRWQRNPSPEPDAIAPQVSARA